MVKMTTLKQEKIEHLLNQIELLMDLRYKINKETDYCNHSYVIKTLLPDYTSTKESVRKTLKDIVDNNYAP